MKSLPERFWRLVLRIVETPIRLYGRFVSPMLARRCKYEPTCSAYALMALRSYGLWRGSVLAGWRLLRCNPFSHGGYDPVEAQTLFRAAFHQVGPREAGAGGSRGQKPAGAGP
jgi:uncharacterized protein